MRQITLVGAAALLFAGMALAHSGVQNHAVMQRMEAMKQSAEAFKVLATMAKGEVAYDAGKAAQVRARLIEQSRQVPSLFRAPERDPMDEAKPLVWQDWADFEARAATSLSAVEAMDVSTLEALKAGVMKVSGTCLDCHQTYRVKKK